MKTRLMLVIECDGEDTLGQYFDAGLCSEAVERKVGGKPETTPAVDIAFSRGLIVSTARNDGWVEIGGGAGEINLCPACYVKFQNTN